MNASQSALAVEHLTLEVGNRRESIELVRDVSFAVRAGRTLCLVGESGCGKTMTALAIMGLLPAGIRARSGTISLAGQRFDPAARRGTGGRPQHGLAMIFQEPMTALNPAYSVGDQIGEALRIHRRLRGAAVRREAVQLLVDVGIPAAAERLHAYPHQLSGGMRQRVMIAMALACDPRVLIADEPTTALDVTVQAQILRLLKKLQTDKGLAIVLVTHDMGVVSEVADDVVVMYAGKVVESGSVERVVDHPAHPYSQALLACMPGLPESSDDQAIPAGSLQEIAGSVPPPSQWGSACPFVGRCERAFARCDQAMPPPVRVTDEQEVLCWLYQAEYEALA